MGNGGKQHKNGYQAKATDLETEEEKENSQVVVGTREIKIEFWTKKVHAILLCFII